MSHLQWNIKQLSKICSKLYRDYCPEDFKYRHNINLSKVSDESLLVLLLLQAELGIKSQRHFYRICQLFPCGHLLERSRFNRRSRQLIGFVQVIRQALNTQISPDTIVIIDSFPLPLCQTVRNHRTRIFEGMADMGYNVSKRLWFYGYMLVTLSGYILNYVVAPASVHDSRAVHDLLENCRHPYILADLDYLSLEPRENLE